MKCHLVVLKNQSLVFLFSLSRLKTYLNSLNIDFSRWHQSPASLDLKNYQQLACAKGKQYFSAVLIFAQSQNFVQKNALKNTLKTTKLPHLKVMIWYVLSKMV